MGVDVSAYIEKKDKDTGKWVLTTAHPISTRLKYIIDDYNDNARIEWDELSDGLKEKFKKDEDGNVYATFYGTSIEKLEETAEKMTRCVFTKLNTIVEALGCYRIYNDDGDELEWGGDDDKEKLTFPINKKLVDDLQMGYDTMRRVGQREAFDLIASEHIDYGDESRIVFAVS